MENVIGKLKNGEKNPVDFVYRKVEIHRGFIVLTVLNKSDRQR